MEGRAIVLVSHSAEQVESVCTRGVVLDHGKLVFDGSTSDAVRILREGFQRDALLPPSTRRRRVSSRSETSR